MSNKRGICVGVCQVVVTDRKSYLHVGDFALKSVCTPIILTNQIVVITQNLAVEGKLIIHHHFLFEPAQHTDYLIINIEPRNTFR